LLAGLSIAVAWHRHIILGEYPRFSGSNIATKNLWRYVGMAILVGLIDMLPALVVALPMILLFSHTATAGAPRLMPAPLFLLFPLLILVGTAVMLRLILLLPARAVGDVGVTFKEMWNRTRGNTWRIFWGLAACTLPPILVAEIGFVASFGFLGLRALASGEFVGFGVVASAMLFGIFYLLILPIGIGFLSHSYGHFFKRT
jgi:hypothetical protein